MARIRPAGRLVTEAVNLKVGGAKLYLHLDRPQRRDGALGPVAQICITASGHDGSDFQQLMIVLTREINRALQTQIVAPHASGP
jgi:hypothetical protein